MASPTKSALGTIPVIRMEDTAGTIPEGSSAWDGNTVERLTPLLQEYITTRRWYRAKTRIIRELSIADVIRASGTESAIVVARIDYTDGNTDTYLIPLSATPISGEFGPPDDILARLVMPGGNEQLIYNALGDPQFTAALLSAVACETRWGGRHGDLVASRTSAFDRRCAENEPVLKATVSRAEQSNSSIIFENRYILKLFRKMEPGINPDIEIGSFLTEHRFQNTPAVLGTLEYRQHDGSSMYAAILQTFVRNQGDAWQFTLDALHGYFKHAVREGRPAPHFKSNHPLHLAETTMPATVREEIGAYLESARLLGERTAEMHAVLASDNNNPEFRPIPFTSEDAAFLHRELLKESDQTFDLLRRKEKSLDEMTAKCARSVLGKESQVRRCLASLPHAPVKALRIRHHGDYHLGQVLAVDGDFMIIDFEGEPARPIAERREKALAVRDVAGMVRSFQYAAYSALRGADGVTPANHATVESWADYWAAWVSATYLCAYFDKAGKASFVPADGKERRTLLDAFLLQKVLYEVTYELNNRPDWVQIPLRGILNLLD
ncbi:MAG TPA: putative maltokinase [Bryobacteraceae bacterium]|nr:putative maltokinase [Bryobacteraceae bacterium]